ncbi:MAG: archaemetzincin family Zn-dependent metalloprotease [Desulfobacterales bacterium]|nr:archaemetzincin family Zn-dependent metalloprotease [Desulfobacterales bacterium]
MTPSAKDCRPKHRESNSPSAKNNLILISPDGQFDLVLLEQIREGIEGAFGFPTVIRSLLDDVEFAYDPKRRQYHSTAILEQLAAVAPPEAYKVLAITRVDLFIPILTYVFGEAQLGGKACIISTHRLMGAGPVVTGVDLYARMAKEAKHELGHTFNLQHCRDPACLMHYCRSEVDVDRKMDQLCRYCRVLLMDALKKLEAEKDGVRKRIKTPAGLAESDKYSKN